MQRFSLFLLLLLVLPLAGSCEQDEVSPVVAITPPAGQVALEGSPRLIESNEPDFLCFDVNEETADRLPRMRHDERRVWFCFTNQEEARQALGHLIGRTVQIQVSDYRTTYQFTDAFDTAKLEITAAAAAN